MKFKNKHDGKLGQNGPELETGELTPERVLEELQSLAFEISGAI